MSSGQLRKASTVVEPGGEAVTIAQRLERLERKIDMLLATEEMSDLHWRGLDTPVDAVHFAAMAKDFADVLDFRNRLHAERTRKSSGPIWPAADETRWQSEFDQSSDRLLALAKDLAHTAASSLGDVRLKAMAVRELVEEDSDDVVHLLAASLCADLFALKDAQ
ncbi:MAG: hypothetical protein ABL904_15980 [Hyphomicrobiaceae bacterium]